jgi:hypothetical protein
VITTTNRGVWIRQEYTTWAFEDSSSRVENSRGTVGRELMDRLVDSEVHRGHRSSFPKDDLG